MGGASRDFVKTNVFNDAVSQGQYASAKIHPDRSKPATLPTEGRQEFWDMSMQVMPDNLAYGIKEIDKQIAQDGHGIRKGMHPRKV